MGKISEKKLAMKDSFPSFGGIFCHFLPEILTKQNTKETACKGKIWGPLYIPKGEHTGQGYRIRKYYVMKNICIIPIPKQYPEMYNNGNANLLQHIFE